MFNFLANIFEAIGSAVTVILISVGLVASPAPANFVDVPADEIVEEITEKQEVETKKVVSSTPPPPQPDPVLAPAIAEPSPKTSPQSSLKTFTTPSGAIVDEFGNILNQAELDRQEEIRLLREQVQILQKATQIKKELVIDTCEPRIHIALGQICESAVYYLENRERKDAEITFTSDDSGLFICNSCVDQTTKANPLTARTRINDRDGKPWLRLLYIPLATGSRKITGVTNGISASITAPGQLEPAPASVPTPRVIDRVLVEVTNSSGNKLRPYSQNTYFLNRDREYFFKVHILDQEGKAFNDVFVEMRNRDSSQVIDSKYTNTYPDPGTGDWYAFFSYTPRTDTLGRSEGLGFHINYKGSAWSTGIDFNTSFQNPKIELIDPTVPKEVKRTDSVRHILKAKITNEGEPRSIDVVRGEVISNNFPEEGVKIDVYIATTNPYSGEANAFVGSGIIKSGPFAITLSRFKIDPDETHYLRFVIPDIATNANFSLKITDMEIVGFISGLYRSILGLPIITPEITISQ